MEPTKRFALRIPESLHRDFSMLAEYEKRSMHAQILWVMQRFVEQELDVIYQQTKEKRDA